MIPLSNITHTFHGGDVPILRSAVEGDRADYRIMLSCARRASEFSPVGRMRHDLRYWKAQGCLYNKMAGPK